MGNYVIRMPDIGEGIAEVEIVQWHVQPGDAVAEDQTLADVMTDKATVAIPSPVAGTVLSLGGTVGETMAVGAELIRFEVDGEGNVKPGPQDGVAAPAAAGPPAATTPAPTPAPAPVVGAAEPAAAAPAVTASEPGPAAPARGQGAWTGQTARGLPLARAADERALASPAVRRRAWDLGIELRFVPGSGPAGRITHQDLDAWQASGGQPAPGRAGGYAQRHDEEAIPLIGLRRRIAQKMQESKRRIPHFSYVEEIDVTELESLRAKLNGRYGAERGKLTLLPLIARAVVLAVREFPQMNARFDDEAGVVTRHGAVHLGIAAQTEAGLMVPVVRHAESLDLWACAAEIGRLAEATRSGRAVRDELSGSTITISSLGPLGGIVTTPVINHPEVAIIGVNRIVERPAIRNGSVVARLMMNLSSSFDHRVVDGMHAAEFVQAIRATLESPALLLVE